MIDIKPFKTELVFGFGIYRWFSPRGKFTSYLIRTQKLFIPIQQELTAVLQSIKCSRNFAG